MLRPQASRCYFGAPVSSDATLTEQLSALFDSERQTRKLHDAVAAAADGRRDALLAAITAAIAEADEQQPDECAIRLTCIARVLGELDGAQVADALIDILNNEQPEARHEAGEQLKGLAFDRFKEVALAVERAVARLTTGSPALLELPYLIIEIPEPGVTKLLERFLKHDDADAVAAAIEALVELGDVSAVKLIQPLVSDPRTTQVEDGEDEATVTVGELAAEALSLLHVEL